MIKQIPNKYYHENMQGNISHYNFNNFINNYEKVFNIENFNVPEYSKDFFTVMLNRVSFFFRTIHDAPLITNEEELTYIESLQNNNVSTLEYSFRPLYDAPENLRNACEWVRDILSGDSDIKIYSLIKTLASTRPLVLFNGIKIVNDTIYNRSKHKIENSSHSYIYLEAIREDFPTLCLSDYYIQYFWAEKLYPKLFQVEPAFNSEKGNYSYIFATFCEGTFLQYLKGKDIELKNEYELLFISWLNNEFISSSEEDEFIELKTHSTISLNHKIYRKPKSIKDLYDSYIDASKDTVDPQYIKENLSHYQRLQVLTWRTDQDRVSRTLNLINVFKRYFKDLFYDFIYSLFDLINLSQIENKTNLTIQKELFDNDYLFTNSNTSDLSLWHFTSEMPIRLGHRNPKSILKEKFNNVNKVYTLTKLNRIATNNDNIIYSHYDESIVNLFFDKALDLSDELFLDNSSTQVDYTVNVITNENKFEKKIITLNNNISHFTSTTFHSLEQEQKLKDICSSKGNKKLPVLFVPKLDNKSKKEVIEIRNSTYKTLLNKKGLLVPVILPFEALNDANTKETFNAFTFISIGTNVPNNYSFEILNQLFTPSYHSVNFNVGKSIDDNHNQILEVVNNITNTFFGFNSLFFKDKELYSQKLNEFYGGINLYTNNNLQLIKQKQYYYQSILDAKKTTDLGQNFNQPNYAKVFAKVQIDKTIENKYNKINQKYKKVKESRDEQLEQIQDLNSELETFKQRLDILKRQLQNTNDSIVKKNQSLTALSEMLKTLESTKDELKQQYENSYNESIDNGNVIVNPYLLNTLANNVNVSYILFVDENLNTILYYNEKDYEELLSLSNSLHEAYYSFEENPTYKYTFDEYEKVNSLMKDSTYKISKVCFTTVKPSLIKIDNEEKYVVGGPYRIVVTEHQLKTGLLNLSSVFGKKMNRGKISEIKPHPHTNCTSFNENKDIISYLHPHSSCLGEATSLIYNAFKDNDLSRIIISVMIWVKSANSADYWGKNYNWFPKPEQINCTFEELTNLPSLQEIDSFIDQVLEEEENEVTTEELVSLVETEQPQTQRNIEDYNTDQMYRRYIS